MIRTELAAGRMRISRECPDSFPIRTSEGTHVNSCRVPPKLRTEKPPKLARFSKVFAGIASKCKDVSGAGFVRRSGARSVSDGETSEITPVANAPGSERS